MTAVATVTEVLPAVYATGGVVVATGLASISSAHARVRAAGAVAPFDVEVTPGSPGAGDVTVRVLGRRYDRLATVDAVTGLPGGVSAAGVSGQTVVADTAHTHALNHNHAAAVSGANSTTGGGTTLDLTAPVSISDHTHSFDPPVHAGLTGGGDSHDHVWDSLYDHDHAAVNTVADALLTEVAAGTDLSSATVDIVAVGT